MKGICIFFYIFAFLFFDFGYMLHFFEHISKHISTHVSKKNPLIFWHFCFPNATLTPSVMSTESLPIKGLPLVCTILSSSPRMAPAHRFWKYGYILPQKTLVTKISAYLGSLIALPCRNKSAN